MDYKFAIRKANRKVIYSLLDNHCYLVLFERIPEDEFDIAFVSVHKEARTYYPHYQVLSFLRNEDLSYVEFRLEFNTDSKITVIEIDPNLFAKAERMVSLYQASVKALFNGAAAAIEGHPHVDEVGLEFARPYIVNANDSWSLLYVTIQFKVELAIQGQKRLYQFFSKCINENGRMKDSFLYSGRFPYSDCYEIPRPIFLSLIARHKSYCESILSLASEYICPPSTTIDIRHIL